MASLRVPLVGAREGGVNGASEADSMAPALMGESGFFQYSNDTLINHKGTSIINSNLKAPEPETI